MAYDTVLPDLDGRHRLGYGSREELVEACSTIETSSDLLSLLMWT